MKTKYWIVLLLLLLVLCAGLSFFLLRPGEASAAQVLCDGKVLAVLPLSVDQERVFETEFGTNTVTVKDGKIAVTRANCPDGYCMARGFCAGGPQIVCLPNRLVIAFTRDGEVDAMVG